MAACVALLPSLAIKNIDRFYSCNIPEDSLSFPMMNSVAAYWFQSMMWIFPWKPQYCWCFLEPLKAPKELSPFCSLSNIFFFRYLLPLFHILLLLPRKIQCKTYTGKNIEGSYVHIRWCHCIQVGFTVLNLQVHNYCLISLVFFTLRFEIL